MDYDNDWICKIYLQSCYVAKKEVFLGHSVSSVAIQSLSPFSGAKEFLVFSGEMAFIAGLRTAWLLLELYRSRIVIR